MYVEYVKMKTHAGFRVRGDRQLLREAYDFHSDSMLWLVAQIEMPSGFGSVQSYDGAGMSAGVLHHTAVLPKQVLQGSLWKLLARMRACNSYPIERLFSRFHRVGWVLGPQGLRYQESGLLVSGKDIRAELNADDRGCTPESGDGNAQAKDWALLFSRAFADPATHRVQTDVALEWLLQSCGAVEGQAYTRAMEESTTSIQAAHMRLYQLYPVVDLTMSVYHSFSANAPSVARQVLQQVLAKPSLSGFAFCKELIYRLGTRKYRRWADRPDGKSRYDRTREAALRHWDPSLVNSVMPENLKR